MFQPGCYICPRGRGKKLELNGNSWLLISVLVWVSAGLSHPCQEEEGRDDSGPPEAEKGSGSGPGPGSCQISHSSVNKHRKSTHLVLCLYLWVHVLHWYVCVCAFVKRKKLFVLVPNYLDHKSCIKITGLLLLIILTLQRQNSSTGSWHLSSNHCHDWSCHRFLKFVS